MSILNRPSDGLLTVLLALRRAIIAYGPQTDSRLLELCAPDSSAISDPGMARKTLTRWAQLRLFEERDGLITLAPMVREIEADDLQRLRSALLGIVLSAENNPNLAADRDGDEDARSEKSKAGDFSLAASWALAQDPYSFAHTYSVAETMLSEQRVGVRIFSNSTRWNGFIEWAHFLGIGVRTSRTGLILNPSVAVASVLNQVFEETSELNQEAFLSRLAEALPIVEGGRYRRVVDAATAQPWRTAQGNQVSPCLSVALQTLVEGKVIRLEPRSDAPQRTLLGRRGREGYTFSHVVRLMRAVDAEA